MTLDTSGSNPSPYRERKRGLHKPYTLHGFSMIELVATIAVILVVSAIAIPSVMRSWATYRLSSSAADVAGILKRTRFEAIRRNTIVNCLIQQQGNGWILGADLNNNGQVDPTEPQVFLAGPVRLLLPGIAPGPASMGYPNAQVAYPGGAGAVAFDPRGSVNFGGNPQVVYVLYLGYADQVTYGFRAVTLLPLATTKIWSSGQAGPWHSPSF